MDIRPYEDLLTPCERSSRPADNSSTRVHITAILQKTLHLQEKKCGSGTVPRVHTPSLHRQGWRTGEPLRPALWAAGANRRHLRRSALREPVSSPRRRRKRTVRKRCKLRAISRVATP